MTRRIVPAAAGTPALEPISQELYDTKPFPAVGANTLLFFRNPSALGELYTNMQGSGQLPHPQQFHAFGIAVEILPHPEELRDFATGEVGPLFAGYKKKIREMAWLRFGVGSKDYLTIPLIRVPEGIGPAGYGEGLGADQNTNILTNGVQDIKHAYELTVPQQGKIKPVHIPAQQAFFVEIRWVAAVAMPEELLSTPVDIRVYLLGVLWREVQ